MTKQPRLIEVAFPLKQASLDSVHEKNVRHGHISTLHIWPARRPLAACRAALIATLLPDPGTPEERQRLLEKIGGKVIQRIEKTRTNGKIVEKVRDETVGGILHWGRESNADVDWFRDEIRKAYGGRAPKVLDPFAGGGAIPLEAMRLGCEATAIDINPVAWFILKCTLEYPQKISGQKRPLPAFVRQDRAFMEAFFKAQGYKGARLRGQLNKYDLEPYGEPMLAGMGALHAAEELDADLAWHVRAWGSCILDAARKDLAGFYPTYADFQPLAKDVRDWPKRVARVVPVRSDGTPDLSKLNVEFDEKYLVEKNNPRWVSKPTVAYLWARTVKCKNCRAIIPLLKTRWLCKRDNKRVLLTMVPNTDKTGVVFGVQSEVPLLGGNGVQRRDYDKRIGAGTMSKSGVTCPCCNTPSMVMEDLRLEGRAGRIGTVMTAVVIEGLYGKEYRLPTELEGQMASEAEHELSRVFAEIPFGLPNEPLPKKEALGFRVPLYGYDQWHKLYTPRQLLALGTFVKHTRDSNQRFIKAQYPADWSQALLALLACVVSRTADYMANLCVWEKGAEEVKHVFMRWALPITWDFAEANPLAPIERFYQGGLNSVIRVISFLYQTSWNGIPSPVILNRSAIIGGEDDYDLIFTDPPYYGAIPYSDLMDFFYVWLRRTVHGLSPDVDDAFRSLLAPKWDSEKMDGELIDDESRHGGDAIASKNAYEDGMYRAFSTGSNGLKPDGHLVVVFANKNPSAWETLAASIIRAGFCVTGSWPIATEMPGGLRNLNRASLASSIWLICRKRPTVARPGWDNRVLDEMRNNIYTRLHEYWDAGIRGPDFVWAATGPALEAYSQYPVVKKANAPNQLMSVSEFLKEVRRIVVDFVVGRVLSHNGSTDATIGLDDVTTYYLLHRHDFSMGDAPIGACILYAISCNLSDAALVNQYDILIHSGGRAEVEEEDEEEETNDVDASDTDSAEIEGTASKVRLRAWSQRRRPGMGYDPAVDSSRARKAALNPPLMPEMQQPVPKTREIPLIDQMHRLMHLWKAGDAVKVNDYLDQRALRKNALFLQLLQALIELAPAGSEERSLLESISNHLVARGVEPNAVQSTYLQTDAQGGEE